MTTTGRESDGSDDGLVPFDPLGPLPARQTAIEASAGTGKTHALATLATRFVAEAGVSTSELLVVTFTRAAANDLRAKVRRRFLETADLLETGSPAAGDDLDGLAAFLSRDDATGRLRRLRQAVTEFDAATVTTIHGFAFQVRAALGAGSGADAADRLLPDHLALLRAACTDVLAEASVGTPSADVLPELDTLVRLADQLDGRPDLVCFPSRDDVGAPDDIVLLNELVTRATELARQRRRTARMVSFDDILTRFRSVLSDTIVGSSAVRHLRSRYRVVLIDEFQDTDPVQWDIFWTLFGNTGELGRQSSLVLVGDPKQSIYGFRGADVHTYHRAVGDRGTARRMLATNWRSDGALLDTLAALLDGANFGEGIAFHRVHPPPDHQSRRARDVDGQPLPALSIRLAVGPGIAHQHNDSQFVLVTPARAAILDDLGHNLRHLLDQATIPDDEASGSRPVRPGDVAVLVPRHQDALDVQSALGSIGIPAVVTRAGSVLESEAASQLRWLFHAMERPSDLTRVRLAALSWFGGWSADRIAAAGDDDRDGDLVSLQERLRSWTDALAGQPVAAVLARIRGESGVLGRLLAEPDGDRHVTDLDHLAELLGAGSGRCGPATLLDLLDDVPDPAIEGDAIIDVDDDPTARRLESDADCVQVMTTWSAKGLEFPIVALPMAWWEASYLKPDEYVDPDNGVRTLDLTVVGRDHDEYPDPEHVARRRALIDREADGERLRLLYVALTRAKHMNLVWWARTRDSECSALARVLFARRDGRIDPEQFSAHRIAVPADEDVLERLQPLTRAPNAEHRNAMTIESVEPTDHVGHWVDPRRAAADVDLAVSPAPSPDRHYQRWSFSRMVDRTAVDQADPSDESLADSGAADETTTDDGEPADVPVTLGGPAGEVGDAGAEVGPGGGTDSPAGVNPMAVLAGGTAFGTLVHTLLERGDWQAPDVRRSLEEELAAYQVRRPLELVVADGAHNVGGDRPPRAPRELLLDGLCVALFAPLGRQFLDRGLAEIPRSDRLAELDFDLLLGTAGRLPTTREIAEVVRDALPADDRFRTWAETLALGSHELVLGGNLTGSVDLVVRLVEPSGLPRFVIADYKTNALHRPGTEPIAADYAPDRLTAAMVEHDYPLQALLYSVALHRYLRWRLPDYDPEQHLGGVAYLFIRGMDGSVAADGTPRGVATWPLPAQVVVGLSDLLDGAAVGAVA